MAAAKKTKQTIEPGGKERIEYCSFCRKSSSDRMMIAGPPDPSGIYKLFICEDCVDVAVKIFTEAGVSRWIRLPEQKSKDGKNDENKIDLIPTKGTE